MSETPIVVCDPIDSRDNEVRPFQIEGMDVRGRAVRIGTVTEQILNAHDYPEPIAKILGELLALTGLLGSMLKYEGIVTLQIRSEGPVKLMVADYQSKPGAAGVVRGYAQIDDEVLAQYGKNVSFGPLVTRKGHLAITIDQGKDMERYQGIVEMKGDCLSDVAREYFANSEQLPTEIRLACDRDPVSGHWRAGGIMVQYLARGEVGQERILARDTSEHWNRAGILMKTVKLSELLDPSLTLDQLLYRLFVEDGVRVFDSMLIKRGCRCSDERIRQVIEGFGEDDLAHMTVDGKITATCEFCNTHYAYNPSEFSASKT